MRRRLAPALLAIALLAGWQEALLHPLEHVDEHGYLVHVGDGHADSHGHDSPDPSGKLCDTLAALTACAPEAPATLAVAVGHQETPSHRFGAPRAAEAPPFRAQAPPSLL